MSSPILPAHPWLSSTAVIPTRDGPALGRHPPSRALRRPSARAHEKPKLNQGCIGVEWEWPTRTQS
jgi:hypothetical protein